MTNLLDLPSELFENISSYSTPQCLGRLAKTCRQMRTETILDRLWMRHVNENLIHPLKSPAPFPDFRSLYTAFHHFWFLPRHRFWMSNEKELGSLVVARYNATEACIELLKVVGTMGTRHFVPYSRAGWIEIATYSPAFSLHLQRPLFRIYADYTDEVRQQLLDSRLSSIVEQSPGCRQVAYTSGTDNHSPPACLGLLSDARYSESPVEAALASAKRNTWPPPMFPAPARICIPYYREPPLVRKILPPHGLFSYHTAPNFTTLAEVMSTPPLAAHPGHANHYISDITPSIFATFERKCYTPTKDKPYQGIWCGDYNGHGIEYLVLIQPDRTDEAWPLEYLDVVQSRRRRRRLAEGLANDEETDSDESESNINPMFADMGTEYSAPYEVARASDAESGDRLVALKLTGDPNVPRGEVTFVAPSISERHGTIRVADEEEFRGVRVVRALGHVAGLSFSNDTYISTQLYLISHDCLAQHWIDMNNFVYYYRIDVDALLDSGLETIV